MASNENNMPNAQTFIATFTQCNIATQEVTDQLIRGILLDTTHNMVQLINLLTLQFDNLLKQLTSLQERIEIISEKQTNMESKQKEMVVEQQGTIFSNLYDIIAYHLQVNVQELKCVTHRNIVAENSDEDLKYAELLDNNKVNNKILDTICLAYQCKLFIFNGRTRQKSYHGENDEKLIKIFHIRNKYQQFKKKSSNYINKVTSSQNQKQDVKKNYKSKQQQRQNQKQGDLVDEIKKVVSKIIHNERFNEQKKMKVTSQQQEPLSEEDVGIYCEKCGSGAIYTSNMMEKHHQRINFTKIQELMGIEADSYNNIPIKQDESQLKNQIKLISWNVGSLKQAAFDEIKKQKAHLICLQEVRNKVIQDSVKYKYYYRKRDTSNSGGVIIGVHQQFQSKDITSFYFQNSEEEIIFPDVIVAQIINPVLNLILINVYFHRQSEYKKYKLYFWNKVIEIIAQLSNNQQLIICGDFNYEDLGVSFMIDAFKDMATFKRLQVNRILSSITDHILLLKNVQHQTSQIWIDSFDHSILNLHFDASLLLDTAQQNEYLTISKERAIKCCQYISNNGNIESFSCFYKQYKKCLWKKRIISKTRIRIKPIRYQTENNYLEQLKASLKDDKKEFFNVIKKTLILHQQRRDGSIFNCFINENKQLCTGKQIFLNCTQILDKLSNIQEQEPKPISQLPELSQEEVENMQKKMAYDKAISYDGITHQFIRQCNWKIINDVWNKTTFEVNKKLGWVRLCPLNKCHPEIPKSDQFRPLVIMSPLLKFLELRFHDKLQVYLRDRILKPQTGFISGIGTQVNIFLILNWIRQTEKSNNQCLIFIDFSSAYNTIHRQRLYEVLKKKKILTEVEVEYLEAIHSRIVYVDAYNIQNKVYFKNGVPQGSPISPALFNIYLDEFLRELLQISGNSFQFQDMLMIFLSALWNLRVNNKKSGLMPIKLKTRSAQICELPVVQNYKYLGIEIDYKGTISLHLKTLKTKINYINYKLFAISTAMEFAQRLFLYRIYIEPYFIYMAVASSFNNKTMSQKIIKYRKKAFKQLMRLPSNTPDKFLECFLANYQLTIRNSLITTFKKIAERGLEHQNDHLNDFLRNSIPYNFQLLFKFAWTNCPDHNQRCTFKHILTSHLSLTQDDLVPKLLYKLQDNDYKIKMEQTLEQLKYEIIIQGAQMDAYNNRDRK